MWFKFLNDLLSCRTMISNTVRYCTYRNYRMEEFFVWCDLDEEDTRTFWGADNDNNYVRML